MDIDRLHQGPARSRSGCRNSSTYGSEVMRGRHCVSMSQDTVADEASRTVYYAIEVEVDRNSIPKEINSKLVAGMTVDVVIPTEKPHDPAIILVSPLLNRLQSRDARTLKVRGFRWKSAGSGLRLATVPQVTGNNSLVSSHGVIVSSPASRVDIAVRCRADPLPLGSGVGAGRNRSLQMGLREGHGRSEGRPESKLSP